MGVAALAFVVIFILIGSAGLLLFYREAMVQRLSGLVTPGQKKASLLGTSPAAWHFAGQQHDGAVRTAGAPESIRAFRSAAAPRPGWLP